LWPGYKTGAGIDPRLLAQFPLLEDALRAFGLKVWAMIEYEADDALAAAAIRAAADPRVKQVRICTPDKDLAQCVSGTRIVQEDRLRRTIRDEAGVVAKFGVPPLSIPDYLALVGDSSDGYPGISGWGAKSAAAVLAKFQHINQIPADWRNWGVNVARPGALSAALEKDRPLAMLFRDLATLRSDIHVFDDVNELEWKGPTPAFDAFKARFDSAPVG
jgi:5'-3' exonuclease